MISYKLLYTKTTATWQTSAQPNKTPLTAKSSQQPLGRQLTLRTHRTLYAHSLARLRVSNTHLSTLRTSLTYPN